MKYVIRALYLVAVFIAALVFFIYRADNRSGAAGITLTDIKDSTLPILSTRVDSATFNSLYGYTTELDPLSVRTDFATTDKDNALTVIITERGTDVRKLRYSLYDVKTGKELEEGEINAFEYTETGKDARLRFNYGFNHGDEYAVKLTLITSNSKRVYYYFRLKTYDECFVSEKIAFVRAFSEACLSKKIEFVIPYLESTYRDKGTDYSHINITDSFYMVCFGDLKPTLVSEVNVDLLELYKYLAVCRVTYTVSLDTPSGLEKYLVTENYRINLGSNYTYLLDYERNMDAVFDPALTSTAKKQLKLGITTNSAPKITANADSSLACFVLNNRLYYYDITKNTVINVFSAAKGFDYPSSVNTDCDITVLRMSENGDIYFILSGLMNCGEYEGKTGIVLYKYLHTENRVVETLYIPIAEPPSFIRQGTKLLAYVNEHDCFYFIVGSTLFSYNLTTSELKPLTEKLDIQRAVFSLENSYIAWQDTGSPDVRILYLDTGRDGIFHEDNTILTIYGMISGNVVLGYSDPADTASYSDRTVYYPSSCVRILNRDLKVLKEYKKEKIYVTDAEISDNTIKLLRLEKTDSGYKNTDSDFIIIHERSDDQVFKPDERVTDSMMTEHYINLPSKFTIKQIPSEKTAGITVIGLQNALKVDSASYMKPAYNVYSFGKLIKSTNNLVAAIKAADADNVTGTVIPSSGYPIWEKGVQNKEAALSDAVLEEAKNSTAFDDMAKINGVSLREVLYFIYKDIPVYTMPNQTTTYLLTAYTQSTVTYYNMNTKRTYTVQFNDLDEVLRNNSNIFHVDIR